MGSWARPLAEYFDKAGRDSPPPLFELKVEMCGWTRATSSANYTLWRIGEQAASEVRGAKLHTNLENLMLCLTTGEHPCTPSLELVEEGGLRAEKDSKGKGVDTSEGTGNAVCA